MAARAPTSATKFVNDSNFYGHQIGVAQRHAEMVDNQEYTLDLSTMAMCDVCCPFAFSDTTHSATWTVTPMVYHIDGRDLCDTSGRPREDCQFSVLTWLASGTDTWEIQVHNGTSGNNASITINASQTSKIWRAYTTITNGLETSTAENLFSVRVRHLTGTGTIYIGGIAIFSA